MLMLMLMLMPGTREDVFVGFSAGGHLAEQEAHLRRVLMAEAQALMICRENFARYFAGKALCDAIWNYLVKFCNKPTGLSSE